MSSVHDETSLRTSTDAGKWFQVLGAYYDQCQSSTTSTVVKAPLVRASLVKWCYIKYLALPLPFFYWKSTVAER